jgi:hypothetical protein
MAPPRPSRWAGCCQVKGDAWTLAHDSGLNLAAAGTLEFWMYVFGEDLVNFPVVLSKGNLNTAYTALIGSDDKVVGRVTISSSLKDAQDPNTVPRNTWVHYAMRWNGTNVQLLRDGTQVASTAASGSLDTNSNPLYLGDGNTAKANTLAALLYDVRLWSEYRNDGDITANMSVPLNGDEANLVANWFTELDDAIGRTVKDKASGGRDLLAKQSHQWSYTAGFPYSLPT